MVGYVCKSSEQKQETDAYKPYLRPTSYKQLYGLISRCLLQTGMFIEDRKLLFNWALGRGR